MPEKLGCFTAGIPAEAFRLAGLPFPGYSIDSVYLSLRKGLLCFSSLTVLYSNMQRRKRPSFSAVPLRNGRITPRRLSLTSHWPVMSQMSWPKPITDKENGTNHDWFHPCGYYIHLRNVEEGWTPQKNYESANMKEGRNGYRGDNKWCL